MSDTTDSGTKVLLDKTVKAALAFASRDETRPILTGVRVTPESSHQEMTALLMPVRADETTR